MEGVFGKGVVYEEGWVDAPMGWGGREKNATGPPRTAESSWVESGVEIWGSGFCAFLAFWGALPMRTLASRVRFGRFVAEV